MEEIIFFPEINEGSLLYSHGTPINFVLDNYVIIHKLIKKLFLSSFS